MLCKIACICIAMVSCVYSDNCLFPYLGNSSDIQALIPENADTVFKEMQHIISEFRKDFAALKEIPEEKRSFENTIKRWDIIEGKLLCAQSFYQSMSLVHTDKEIREACQKAQVQLEEELLSAILGQTDLYDAVLAVQKKRESLPTHHQYYIDELSLGLKQFGCHLPKEDREKLFVLRSELTDLGVAFERNIQEDQSLLYVDAAGLEGLDDDFIKSLPQNTEGLYELSCHYPIYFPVMQHCLCEETRKKFGTLFSSRAYPSNEPVLKQMIAKRQEMARLIGYDSFSAYQLSSQMAKNVEKVRAFLEKMHKEMSSKADKEFVLMTENLPKGVKLNDRGQMNSYDSGLVFHHYAKEKFSMDAREIAEYFPLNTVLQGLYYVYSQFFDLEIKELSDGQFWHKDVKLLSIQKKGEDFVSGYLLLDLFPRNGKFSHACECSLIPAYIGEDQSKCPALSLVVTNFPTPKGKQPSLLQHSDVKTLFHEFGHALHEILGRSDMLSMAGTRVKTDFVELPSQLLEEWTWDPYILSLISGHYLTKKSLPSHMIESILQARTCIAGLEYQRQCFLSKLSLEYFAAAEVEDPIQMSKNMRSSMMAHYLYPEKDFFPLSFGHLDGYGSKYYGYLWARVLAADVFDKIKTGGLLNPEMGNLYIEKIIGQGGMQDPNILLENFLGREPSSDAFIRSLSPALHK